MQAYAIGWKLMVDALSSTLWIILISSSISKSGTIYCTRSITQSSSFTSWAAACNFSFICFLELSSASVLSFASCSSCTFCFKFAKNDSIYPFLCSCAYSISLWDCWYYVCLTRDLNANCFKWFFLCWSALFCWAISICFNL